MWTIIIFALIPFLFVLVNEIKDGSDSFWGTIAMSIGGAVIGGFVGILVAAILPRNYKIERWSEQLYSLQDGQTIHGSFFIGIGSIDGQMQYAFYIKRNEMFQLWTVEYYNATIQYTDTTPKCDITSKHKSNSLWNKFAIGFFDNKERWTCVFKVPKGSIKNNYNLDAQ